MAGQIAFETPFSWVTAEVNGFNILPPQIRHQGNINCCFAHCLCAAVESRVRLQRARKYGMGYGYSFSVRDFIAVHGNSCIDIISKMPYTVQWFLKNGFLLIGEEKENVVFDVAKFSLYWEVNALFIADEIEREGPIIVNLPMSSDFKFEEIYEAKGQPTRDLLGRRINHYVVLVGFHICEGKVVFFEFLNSWGEAWGERGIGRVSASVVEKCALCKPDVKF